ncbi:hypothetical protein [Pseudomonas sp. YL-218 TE3947]|jgi:hypothetical protein|uniref:hypothetical protein n=1 Tax=Pseudomonas TaxID=286 RepID=UPI003D1EDDB2
MQLLTTLRINLRGTLLAMDTDFITGQMTHVDGGLFSYQPYLADKRRWLVGEQP